MVMCGGVPVGRSGCGKLVHRVHGLGGPQARRRVVQYISQENTMNWMDRIVAWNARQAKSWTIPVMVLKAFVGYLLGGVVLAVIVPFLHARGVSLQEWMAWGVILTTIVACVGPDVYYRLRHRRGLRS